MTNKLSGEIVQTVIAAHQGSDDVLAAAIVDSLTAEDLLHSDEDMKEAQRYRWLRTRGCMVDDYTNEAGDELDATCDAGLMLDIHR